ncbi:MAG TPA: hypothetical protein VHY35_09625 [Stellaceae bacterium]|jgi:hypothetical protein|nr:hypothetical protein [Stellaceae bacterium]
MEDTLRDAPEWGFLISPTGRWFAEGGSEFLREIDDPSPDYDASLFAVKNLGFVRVRQYSALTEITLHPTVAAVAAIDAAISTLSLSPAKLFRVKHLQAEWHDELKRSAGCTAARLAELSIAVPGGLDLRGLDLN